MKLLERKHATSTYKSAGEGNLRGAFSEKRAQMKSRWHFGVPRPKRQEVSVGKIVNTFKSQLCQLHSHIYRIIRNN